MNTPLPDLDAIEALLTKPAFTHEDYLQLRAAAPSLLSSARREKRLEALLRRCEGERITQSLRDDIAKEFTQ